MARRRLSKDLPPRVCSLNLAEKFHTPYMRQLFAQHMYILMLLINILESAMLRLANLQHVQYTYQLRSDTKYNSIIDILAMVDCAVAQASVVHVCRRHQ